MWQNPNQPPEDGRPPRRPGPPEQYPLARPRGTGYGGGENPAFGNAPTERMSEGGFEPYGPPPAAPDYGTPPPFKPERPPYSGGQTPQWPGPGYDRPQRPPQPPYAPQQPPGYPHELPRYAPAAPPAPRRYTPPPQQQYAPASRREERRPAHKPRSLPHLPIAHVFLIAGILAMAYAISQPWGVDANGAQVFVRDFGSSRLSNAGIDGGTLALRAATGIVVAAAVLSAALILLNTVVTILNKALGVVGLSGCASLAFFPILWGGATLLTLVLLAAAGFAGLGALSHLPTVASHGFSVVSVQQNGIGFYLWCGGIGSVFIGMLGQLMLRRR
jgi:hypothetical protein